MRRPPASWGVSRSPGLAERVRQKGQNTIAVPAAGIAGTAESASLNMKPWTLRGIS